MDTHVLRTLDFSVAASSVVAEGGGNRRGVSRSIFHGSGLSRAKPRRRNPKFRLKHGDPEARRERTGGWLAAVVFIVVMVAQLARVALAGTDIPRSDAGDVEGALSGVVRRDVAGGKFLSDAS